MSIYKNHLKVAYRSVLKHRFYSTVNVLGLSIAIAFVFLSYLFLQNELDYDQFHKNGDTIYRAYSYNVDTESGAVLDGSTSGVTPAPLGPTLKEDVSTITHATRFGSATGTITLNNIPYQELICMVDPDFLEMFSYPILAGNQAKPLDELNAILLSQDKATKFFGENNPVGQTLKITMRDSTKAFIVAGIIDNRKMESSIDFDILVPFPTMGMAASEHTMSTFNVSFVETYVKTKNPVEGNLSKILTAAIKERTDDDGWSVALQPLTSLHFDTKITGIAGYTNPQKLWSIGALVLLVLIIAVINFIALTTGHSLTRVKEMGLRKTLGTFRSALRIQLIAESLVFTLFSGMLGMALGYILLPFFNQLIEATIPVSFSAISIAFVAGLCLALSLICGLSQSAILVKMTPVEALKGNNVLASKESWLNQGLIVLQFSISILLIIGTIAIRSQMNFIQQKDLGFENERLVEISLQSPESLEDAKLLYNRFRSEALQNPTIISVAASMNSFQESWTQFGFAQEEGPSEKIHFNLVESTYLDVMKMEFVEGEAFSKNAGASATSIIVNESLVKHFGWENALEGQIPGRNFDRQHKIIGVVKDFHYSTLHNRVEPIILAVNHESVISGATELSTQVWPPNLYQLVVRVGPGEIQESMAVLEETWKKVNGYKPFTYAFVDDSLAKNYAEEAKWQKLIDVASAFAILIAWMGLLGLMRISVQKRWKEIGIRKVLGSSILDVSVVLSKRFLLLIGIANLIAWPIAWMGVNKWLKSFEYRIEMNVFLLLLGGLSVMVVAFISVGLQARKAATVNPIECLRSE